jgi:lipopolysaccharide export system protein LptA
MRLFILLMLLMAAPALAEDAPVSIEASGQLEWLRAENKYRANGDVLITQGTTTIKGDTAEAQYDPEKGQSALTLITVTGNVVITDKGNTITAGSAIYDTRTQTLSLRGGNVAVKSDQATVTASEMDYFAAERKAVAKGNAVATQENKKIKAGTITAHFSEGNKLEKAEASGNVTMTQTTAKGTDIAQSQFAQYDLNSERAMLKGDVKLTQGQNHMQGDMATMDMKTGVATMASDPRSTGRVRAVFTTDGKVDIQ